MKFAFNKQNATLMVLGCFLLIFGIGITIDLNKTSNGVIIETHSIIPFVHGADDDGCAKCHTQPIEANCIECHDNSIAEAPPLTIEDDIDFPHHDAAAGGPPDNCGVSACHDAGSDGRFVAEPEANHNYCDSCHGDDLSHG